MRREQIVPLLVTLTGLIFIPLNIFSGIVAVIWLIIVREWGLLVFGVITGFVMPWGYSIALLPTFPLLGLLTRFVERGNKKLTILLGFVMSFYTNIVNVLWVYYVFNEVTSNSNHLVAKMLWGYSITMGPLGYMASKEDPDNSGTFLGLLIAQISYFLLVILFIFNQVSMLPLIILAAAFSLIAVSIVGMGMKSSKTILYIEDEPEYRQLIKKLLEDAGYTVIDVGEAGNIYEILNKYKVDLIISCIMLPVKDGLQILQEVRNNKKYEQTPYMFLTNLGAEPIIKEAFNRQATSYLIKSEVTTQKIVEEVNLILNKTK